MPPDEYGQLSTLTAARQTMMSWAKVVESREDVPEAFRQSYRAVAPEGVELPYTVFAPVMSSVSRRVTGHDPTEKLLCEAGDTMYIWERTAERVAMVAFPLKAICALEVGEILLYSWLTISGVTQDATTCSSLVVEFNQATARHFAPFVNKMRPAPEPMAKREESAERDKLNYLGFYSHKFRNYALESLVGGDRIVQTLWQPKISKPLVKVGGRVFYQSTVSLAHVAVLTERELIILQDDERSRENRGVRYGGKRRYIPLSHVREVALLDESGDLVRLCLTLAPGGRQVEITFSAERKHEITQLQDELAKLIGDGR